MPPSYVLTPGFRSPPAPAGGGGGVECSGGSLTADFMQSSNGVTVTKPGKIDGKVFSDYDWDGKSLGKSGEEAPPRLNPPLISGGTRRRICRIVPLSSGRAAAVSPIICGLPRARLPLTRHGPAVKAMQMQLKELKHDYYNLEADLDAHEHRKLDIQIKPRGNPGQGGPRGDKGPTGPMGTVGAPGPPGLRGYVGSNGERGSVGSRGAQGSTGPIGPPGINGELAIVLSFLSPLRKYGLFVSRRAGWKHTSHIDFLPPLALVVQRLRRARARKPQSISPTRLTLEEATIIRHLSSRAHRMTVCRSPWPQRRPWSWRTAWTCGLARSSWKVRLALKYGS